MADSSFHEKTRLVKPQQPCKATTYWAAVLLGEKKTEGPKVEEDYLWVKCHQKITVEVVRAQYLAIRGGEDIVLRHNGTLPDGSVPMKDLDIYNDHVIAFEAIKKTELASRVSTPALRQPLQPSGPNIPQEKVIPQAGNGALASDYTSPWVMNQDPSTLQSFAQTKSRNTPLPMQDENLIPASARAYTYAGRQALASGSEEIQTRSPVGNSCMAPRHLSARSTSVQPTAGTTTTLVKEEEKVPELGFHEQFAHGDEPASQGEPAQPQFFQLQNFIADASLEILEASVEKGVEFLHELKKPLLDKLDESPDAAQWIQQIERLQSQATKTKTVIGVVGNTGAGKSSVINAMLDEERLVPTNTMRACTAVVTELSYNYESAAYRAEIEFISVADWEKELHILFQDLFDASGNISRDCTSDPDSDAGIAYAKIRAVYPKKTKDDICNSSIQKMLQDVSHILGKTRDIKENDSLVFYKHLQRYVDSKEKATGKKDKDKKKEPKEIEFWPLIKVVRIFVKSPALATGAVIVDLPGVHDANAARAAVAEGYMKQCTGLWIVAPIIRAVDDKAAKNLLGESFKRQLKMDGGFSSVTFICSKTDDISLSEASDSLGLDNENGPLWAEMDQLAKKQSQLRKQLEELKETKATYGEAMQDVDDQLEIWEGLREKLNSGSAVYSPNTDKKRKAIGSNGSRKKQKRSSDDEADDDNDHNDEESAEEDDEESEDDEATEDPGSPITEEQITAKISELRGTKKEARRQRTELDDKMKATRSEIAQAQAAEKEIESRISKVCIAGRNAYSKGAIQQDFAAGMKELDQELAAEEDEENFDPDKDIRDYEEVARSLPVFCVSSRGYQKLQGRLKKDPPVPGFQTLQETEVPQLQEHCKQLTVAGRTATCKRFMTNLSQLLNSLTLWASNDGSGANLTAEQRAKEDRFLAKSLANLDCGFERLITTVVNDLKEELGDNIFDKYETAISNAISEATTTCSNWGRPVDRENRAAGGYFWSSYKAVCRRYGVYTNAQGPHDWNAALADPMIKVIAVGWDKAFSRRSPAVLAGLPRSAHNLLKAFHREIELRVQKTGAILPGLHMLQQQLQVYEDIFKDIAATSKNEVDSQQKTINREFVPIIETAMTAAYDTCTEESGPGSFKRMKAAMMEHVDRERHTMFSDSCDEVRTKLKAMLRQVEELLANRADDVFVAISRDYRSVLGGSDAPHGEMMPRWQRSMRKEVKTVIDRAEKIFKRVAGIKVQEDDDEAGADVKDDDDDKASNAIIGQDGRLSEGLKAEGGEATLTAVGGGNDVKMETFDEAFVSDASPASDDGVEDPEPVLEQNTGNADVEMADAEQKKPAKGSRPRNSGVGMSLWEHTSESSTESTPELERGVTERSTGSNIDPHSDNESKDAPRIPYY